MKQIYLITLTADVQLLSSWLSVPVPPLSHLVDKPWSMVSKAISGLPLALSLCLAEDKIASLNKICHSALKQKSKQKALLFLTHSVATIILNILQKNIKVYFYLSPKVQALFKSCFVDGGYQCTH